MPSGTFFYLRGSTMIEADFTRAVHDKLPPTVKAWKIRDDYQGGVPDAFTDAGMGNQGARCG